MFECVACIGLMTIVLGLAAGLFIKALDNNRALKRNAEDIVRALHAGDQWRADIRSANGPIKSVTTNGAVQLLIPSPIGPINYTFSNGELRRQNRLLLAQVQTSNMQADPRPQIHAWHWELELKSNRKKIQVHPLFTFAAATP